MLNKYQPLFLKYRPQAISQLVGQHQVATTLANAIKYDRISHAYLFTGPRGTGKTSTARILAKSLNCERGPTSDPCQTCTACLEIKQGISPSVFEIDAASNNSVDDARLLIERAPLSACGGRFKLYIIDECHMLTKEAFNALLKTIEEPPANVIFILATTEEHKVPATIVSRCQKLIFRLIEEQTMAAHLGIVAQQENIAMEPAAIAVIAKRASGGLRDALSLLDQVSLLGMDGQTVSTKDVLLLTGALPEDILIAMSGYILRKQGRETLSILQELLEQGREAHLIAAELAKHMLNIAKAAHIDIATENKSSALSSYQKALLELSQLVNKHELVQMIEELDRLEIACRRSGQPVMNLEIGLLSLCHRLDIVELQSLQSRLEKLENGAPAKNAAMEHISESQGKAAPNPDDKRMQIKQVNKEQKLATKEIDLVEAPALDDTIQNIEPNIRTENNTVEPESLEFESTMIIDKPADAAKPDIDILWQNILTELQQRHLPTFSLVSTHAFPVSLTEEALTIGVFVENFQKMLENKMEHIKVAATASQAKPGLNIRVKLVPNSENGRAPVQTAKNSDEAPARPSSAAHNIPRTNKDENNNQTAVKEAYRLFEGPGSRFITPT